MPRPSRWVALAVRVALALAGVLIVTLPLLVASPTLGLVAPASPAENRRADTPEPTARPTRRPERTPRPDRSQRPSAEPSPSSEPSPEPVFPALPGREALRVAVREPGFAGSAPLIVARERGYLSDAGFSSLEIVEIEEPLPALVAGEVDIAVVESVDAASGFAQGLFVQAIAGYRNHAGLAGVYGGDLLLAGADLVATEPTTVTAFLGAYIRALRDIADPAQSVAILALASEAGSPVDSAAWAGIASSFAPHDGGFGVLDQDGGLLELEEWLARSLGTSPDLRVFLAWATLNATQVGLGLEANPFDPDPVASGSPGMPLTTPTASAGGGDD